MTSDPAADTVMGSSTSARKWSPFVCPECRFVFRVAEAQAGGGVVCPSCERLLRVPKIGDSTPPLVAVIDSAPDISQPMVQKRRRRGSKSNVLQGNAWEEQESNSEPNQDVSHLRYVLIGGIGLLTFIIAGVVMIMKEKPSSFTPAVKSNKVEQAAKPVPVELAEGEMPNLTDAVVAAQGENLARGFLAAKTIDEALPFLRNPETVKAHLLQRYPDGKIVPEILSQFNSRGDVQPKGNQCRIFVRTGDFEERLIIFVATPDGLKIDWDSWANWSEVSLADFIKTKPTTSHHFRMQLTKGNYYNFDFSDESRWSSYNLESPDTENTLHGYVEKNSAVEITLTPPIETRTMQVILALRFPPDAKANNQVLIERLVQKGWVDGLEEVP